jgi:hypothetical protein
MLPGMRRTLTTAAALVVLTLAGCATTTGTPTADSSTSGPSTDVVVPAGPVATASSTIDVSAGPGLPSTDPTHLAPASNRSKAAAVLRASDAYYQAEFNQGVTVILARGGAGTFDAFHAWYQKAVTGDIPPSIAAFKQADAQFTAADEPSTITDWQADNGTLSQDISGMASDGLGVGGPSDADARTKVEADAKQFRTDFATAEKDAANVEAGK